MKHAKGGFLTIALFALAATLLVFSVVGSSQAALTYFSDTYGAQVSMQDIGVTLVENGNNISWRNYNEESNDANEQNNWIEHTGELVSGMRGTGENVEELKLGKSYDEVLTVRNTGHIDEYVRVSIYKYWEDEFGQKQPALDSNFIKLHLTENSGWRVISQTEERTVLFYEDILGPAEGESEAGKPSESAPFADLLTLEAMPIEQSVKRVNEYTDLAGKHVIETEYTYDGMKFVLRVDVDAVQTHRAADAMRSAWGVSYLAEEDRT